MRRPGPLLLLAVLPACGAPRAWSGLSPDHRTRYVVEERGSRTCVRVGDRHDGCFDGVAVHRLTFAPDGTAVAFPARIGDRWVVVRDGRAGPPVDGVGEIAFGPGGRPLAYAALRGEAWHVVIQDRVGPPHEALVAGTLTVGPGGAVAFGAFRDGRVEVYLAGERIATHDGIARLRFGPRGRLAYVARDGPNVHMSLDGHAGPPHDAVPEYAFGPDGALAYVARDGADWRVLGPGGEAGPFPHARSLRVATGGRATFVVRGPEGEWVWRHGAPGPAYDTIADLATSDADRWGYIAGDGDRAVVMIDGVARGEYPWASDLVLDAGESRYAFVVRDADGTFVVHDGGRARHDIVVDGSLHFTDRGCWAALVGDRDRRTLEVVVEGHATTRPLDWWELSGEVAGQSRGEPLEAADAALRRWVEAEAALIAGTARAGGDRDVRCGRDGGPGAAAF